MKRFIDLFLGLVLLTFSAPVLSVIALLVRSQMGRPVFFRQERSGLHGKPFVIYKFRTMDSPTTDVYDEARVTRLGRILRRYSLDELPQLINVVRGDLSLVGPRPLLMEYLPLYNSSQSRRHEVKPGVTGWAQVNGRSRLTWEEKFELDVWYVEHRSIVLDFRILLMTVRNWLKGESVVGPGNIPFTGSDFER